MTMSCAAVRGNQRVAYGPMPGFVQARGRCRGVLGVRVGVVSRSWAAWLRFFAYALSGPEGPLARVLSRRFSSEANGPGGLGRHTVDADAISAAQHIRVAVRCWDWPMIIVLKHGNGPSDGRLLTTDMVKPAVGHRNLVDRAAVGVIGHFMLLLLCRRPEPRRQHFARAAIPLHDKEIM